MQAYQENISAKVNGVLTPILGVKVTVTDDSTGNPATLFSDNGVSQITGDIVTDETGYFGFFAANGSYTVSFSSQQIRLAPRNIDLYDPMDDAPLTQSQAASPSGASNLGFLPAGIGAASRSVENKLREFVTATDYGTIQQAINAAGTTGSVIIPATYTGMDAYDNPNNIAILDLRHGTLGVHSWIQPAYPVVGYPQGHDLALRAAGPADTYLEKFKTATTTSSALSVGANSGVTIAAVTTGNARAGVQRSGDATQLSTNAGLYIGRNTPSEEYVNVGSWSIADGTHLNITCANSHSAPVDIEQVGSTLLVSPDLYILPNSVNSANATYSPSLRVKDLHGTVMAYVPGNLDPTAGINRYWRWNVIHSGEIGATKDFIYRHQLGISSLLFKDYNDVAFLSFDGTGKMVLARSMEVQGTANVAGTAGSLQFGITSSTAITSTTDAFVTWQNSNDPLNLSATAGSLLLASRNIANTRVHIATQNIVRASFGAFGMALRPPASATPPSIGDMVFEAPNDTTIKIKLKGSDGVVRSGSITLS